MRFRLGYVSGFATGYYLGTRAGRQRYEQINRSLRKLRRSETFDTATVKAREVLDETVDKAKGLIEKRSGDAATDTETGTGVTNGTATVPSAATASPATAAATDGAGRASTTTSSPPVDTGLAPTNPTSNAAGAAPYATETPGKNQP